MADMNHSINISDALFKRLQNLAVPLVDTPSDVVERLLDFYEKYHHQELVSNTTEGDVNKSASEAVAPNTPDDEILRLDPDNPDNLYHTKILQASVNGVELRRPSWAVLLRQVHSLAMKEVKSFNELKRITRSNIREGKFLQDGFQYLNDANISVQKADANTCWRNTLHLAKRCKFTLVVIFDWRPKDGAAHPGKRGELSWPS